MQQVKPTSVDNI